MAIDDSLLPAAAALTGPDADAVLRPAVESSGAELLSYRSQHVQYRPESDLVVRYRCTIRRNGVESTDTLLAATTVSGPPAGTLPVEAATSDGVPLAVGVWRWPFDPVLVGLEHAVTPHLAADLLGGAVGSTPTLEVVAYRPTERAVVRVRRAPDDEPELYLKIVPSSVVDQLVERHDALRAGGLPVPAIRGSGAGWVAMEALNGSTLRDRLKNGSRTLPDPQRIVEVLHLLTAIEPSAHQPVRGRLADAPHHAAMLAAVTSSSTRDRLGGIVARLDDVHRSHAANPGHALGRTVMVHADLHEGQLVVDDDAVIGLLDVDDAGPGDPLDDAGALVAHLEFRSLTGDAPDIAAYAERMREAMSFEFGRVDVDLHAAAVLVGLATGPFRVRQPDWEATTERVLDLVDEHLDRIDRVARVDVGRSLAG